MRHPRMDGATQTAEALTPILDASGRDVLEMLRAAAVDQAISKDCDHDWLQNGGWPAYDFCSKCGWKQLREK